MITTNYINYLTKNPVISNSLTDPEKTNIETAVERYMLPYLRGEMTREESYKQLPLSQWIIKNLYPEKELTFSQEKEIQEVAFNTFMEQATKIYIIHMCILTNKNISYPMPIKPIITEIKTSLQRHLPLIKKTESELNQIFRKQYINITQPMTQMKREKERSTSRKR